MINLIPCKDWEDFKRRIIEDKFPNHRFSRGRFLFRGQGHDDWSLGTSFDRWYQGPPQKKMKAADELLADFKSECEQTDLPASFKDDDRHWLGLAQHHGLPTRLLDWSESPYVAAFFAFSGHIRHGINLTKRVAVWVLDSESHIWDPNFGCEIIRVPSYGNQRLANQLGRFTHLKTPDSSLEDYVKRLAADPGVLSKYTIPVAEASKAVSDLDAMGINHARIYPGLEGNAKAAELRMLLQGMP